jgi:putative oxidoreductase
LPTNLVLAAGRVLVAVELLPNGLAKIAEFGKLAAAMAGVPQLIHGRVFPDPPPLITFPLPELFLAASVALDLGGSLALVAGLRVRGVAALLALHVFIAMLIFHSHIQTTQDLQSLLRNLPLLGGMLLLSVSGGGMWGLDGLRARAR